MCEKHGEHNSIIEDLSLLLRAVPMIHVGWSLSLINEITHQQIDDMAAQLMKKEKENTRSDFFL
jgi:hypothetical protein